MSNDARLWDAAPPSWQSRLVSMFVRAYMRPQTFRPIDPAMVRRRMSRPDVPRRFMVRSTGVVASALPPQGSWPGGELLEWPGAASTAPVLLYLHGGGYLAGSPATHRPLAASLVRRIAGTAFVPNYRLAPEHPFPAAFDDARAAYRHLVDERRIPHERIVIAGDSAGGGLALALALALRDDGVELPAAIVTFSPWTDLAATGSSLDENNERCAMFAGDTVRRATRFYVGAADATHPYLSPLYGDYRGLPPLLIHASVDEVLRDDAVRVAERAREAGLDVEVRLWHRVPHVWQFFPAVLPEAEQSLHAAARFISRNIGDRFR